MQPYVQIKILLNYFNDFVSVTGLFESSNKKVVDQPSDDKTEEIKTVMSYKADLINYANREHSLHSMLFKELVRYVGRAKAKIVPLIKAIAEEKQIEEVPKLTES